VVVWFWIVCGPALALALLSLRGERARAAYVREKRPSTYVPPATIIVPVKGEDEGLRENLAALAAQDYHAHLEYSIPESAD
jgi:cellulose synthase/poly-beta-1,6-N-acetylglucosamine synthase-like glycosyltransferase